MMTVCLHTQKYTLITSPQTAEQNHKLKITNKFFQNFEKVELFGDDSKRIHEKIK
jgi:hypothetical protein